MPARSKFRLAKVHIWSRDGPVCNYGDGWTYEQAWMDETCDGIVVWEIWPLADDIGGLTHSIQHFARSPPADHKGIWAWDGNLDAPTLTPSFLYLGGMGKSGRDWPRIHLYLTAGKPNVLGDSEADLVA